MYNEILSGNKPYQFWTEAQCSGDLLCLHHQGNGLLFRTDKARCHGGFFKFHHHETFNSYKININIPRCINYSVNSVQNFATTKLVEGSELDIRNSCPRFLLLEFYV